MGARPSSAVGVAVKLRMFARSASIDLECDFADLDWQEQYLPGALRDLARLAGSAQT